MIHRLSRSEKELLLLISEGKLNKEIAYELNISPNTVGTRVSKLTTKLSARNRTHLAAIYYRWLLEINGERK